MSGAKKFLAFDIGGTKIAHALTDSRGCLLEEPQRDATPRDNFPAVAGNCPPLRS